ncbi:MAG: PrsW family glutamic-type intramembrane protease [Candidatus Aenigmatarchaeota archaeon]
MFSLICFENSNFILIIFSSLVPILIWLSFVLKEDPHKEPVFFIFIALLLGGLAGIFSYFLEFALSRSVSVESVSYYLISAFIEEFLKFILILVLIFPTKYFDEAIDAMIYMGISALGFAFLENIGNLCSSIMVSGALGMMVVAGLRFLGANFLHLLASTLIGFGYAITYKTRRILPFLISFFIASSLHFLYNMFIIEKDIAVYMFPILWAVFFITLKEYQIIKLRNGE